MASKPPSTRKLVPSGDFEIRDPQRGLVGDRDEQIIDLLNALGQRLIASERERATLKQTVEKLIARQSEIESTQEEYAAKIDRAVAMTDKIEEAISAQARTNRRIEKMHQERVQMLRKLERIEETVIETSEALNAKALVLLTDQKVADKSGQPHLSADTARLPAAAPANEGRPFWHSQIALRVAATGVVVLLGAACGWAIYNFMPASPNAQIAAPALEIDEPADVTADIIPEAEVPQPPVIASAPPQDISTPPVLEQTDEEREALFDEDPDKLAAALNAIEPGVPAAQNAPAAAAEPAPESTPAASAPAATTPPPAQSAAQAAAQAAIQSTAAPAPDSDAFLSSVRAQTPALASRLRPDPALPPVVAEIEKRAFAGNAEAQHDLAAIYTAGHGGVKADYARAASWFTEAALGGVANARYNLGVLYHQGLGVQKDLEKAINWYTAAAALKHPEAQYNLGIAHIEGIGTKYDPEAAAAYFQSAANGGILEAAYNLGLIHENGLLGKIEADKALYWYKQAADRGSPEAAAAMAQLKKSLGLSDSELDAYIGKAAASMPPPPARGAPQAAPAAETPVKKSAVESLRPEDKIDINEVASYIPPVDESELAHPETGARAAQSTVNKPVKDRAIVAQVQEQLMRLGLYPGPADGLTGPQTEDAIRSYQTANNLPGDGRASEALLLHLLTNELNAGGAPNDSGEDEYGSRPE